MSTRYTTRNLDRSREPSKPVSLARARARLLTKLPRTSTGPWRLEYDGHVGRERGLWDVVRRATRLMRQPDGPRRMKFNPAEGDTWALREIEIADRPVPADTPATDPVDRIVGYVRAWCAERDWPITDMGFFANKPGEHGVVPPNAWDAGCARGSDGKLLPADEQHRRNLAVATELRRQGVLHDRSGGREGLPVNGVITLAVYWETGHGAVWSTYRGTFHASHWHVSGKPSQTGWI